MLFTYMVRVTSARRSKATEFYRISQISRAKKTDFTLLRVLSLAFHHFHERPYGIFFDFTFDLCINRPADCHANGRAFDMSIPQKEKNEINLIQIAILANLNHMKAAKPDLQSIQQEMKILENKMN